MAEPPRNPELTLAPAEEADLVRRAQAGDRAAFAQLIDAHWDRLYRWLMQLTRDRHQAEDLAQETVLKVLANLHSFRAGSHFRAWVFRIAHNNFVNLKRTSKRAVQPLGAEPPDRLALSPETTAGDREELAAVARAVETLSPDFRSAILLRADEGLSFKEIAAVLGITEETARWRVFKARQRLVAALEPRPSESS